MPPTTMRLPGALMSWRVQEASQNARSGALKQIRLQAMDTNASECAASR
jgi:hypothetical protein